MPTKEKLEDRISSEEFRRAARATEFYLNQIKGGKCVTMRSAANKFNTDIFYITDFMAEYAGMPSDKEEAKEILGDLLQKKRKGLN